MRVLGSPPKMDKAEAGRKGGRQAAAAYGLLSSPTKASRPPEPCTALPSSAKHKMDGMEDTEEPPVMTVHSHIGYSQHPHFQSRRAARRRMIKAPQWDDTVDNQRDEGHLHRTCCIVPACTNLIRFPACKKVPTVLQNWTRTCEVYYNKNYGSYSSRHRERMKA